MIMSDRICLMNNARIEQVGSPADLYFRPRTVFAADFVGESNLLDAVVESADPSEVVLRGATGALLRAARDPDRPADRGARVKVMVRPEMISVAGNGAASDNVVEARLADVILVGGVTKYYARLADGTEISATGLTRGPVDGIATDAVVRLTWPRECAVVLAAEGPGSATGGAA